MEVSTRKKKKIKKQNELDMHFHFSIKSKWQFGRQQPWDGVRPKRHPGFYPSQITIREKGCEDDPIDKEKPCSCGPVEGRKQKTNKIW
jgi:hypothetical protein